MKEEEKAKEDEAKQPTSKFKTPLLAIALLLIVGAGSAALLSVYASITSSSEVQQSVVATGETIVSATIAGNTYTSEIDVTNNANVTVPIEFKTTCSRNSEDCVADGSITTKYLGKLRLENKVIGGDWPIIEGDGIGADLIYEFSSNTFNYTLSATGLTENTEYSLIYYADKPDRFNNWGGNNPGVLIGTDSTLVGETTLLMSEDVPLSMDLPTSPDTNIDEYDYCISDGFDLCHGAKIWLVPSSDYSEGTVGIQGGSVDWTHKGDYLYETDLITYDDANDGMAGIQMGTGSMTVYVEHTLNPAAKAGTYTLTTEVKPVQIP